VVLELFPNKCVEDGTDAKVNISNVTSDLKGITKFLLFLTGGVLTMHQYNNVEWNPADEKQQYNDEYQPDCLEFGSYS